MLRDLSRTYRELAERIRTDGLKLLLVSAAPPSGGHGLSIVDGKALASGQDRTYTRLRLSSAVRRGRRRSGRESRVPRMCSITRASLSAGTRKAKRYPSVAPGTGGCSAAARLTNHSRTAWTNRKTMPTVAIQSDTRKITVASPVAQACCSSEQ